MRVRRTTADGDICFGHNANDYLVNTPEAVAQNVRTRLALWQGQWFINTDEGTPYLQQILGKKSAADLVIKSRIWKPRAFSRLTNLRRCLTRTHGA